MKLIFTEQAALLQEDGEDDQNHMSYSDSPASMRNDAMLNNGGNSDENPNTPNLR